MGKKKKKEQKIEVKTVSRHNGRVVSAVPPLTSKEGIRASPPSSTARKIRTASPPCDQFNHAWAFNMEIEPNTWRKKGQLVPGTPGKTKNKAGMITGICLH